MNCLHAKSNGCAGNGKHPVRDTAMATKTSARADGLGIIGIFSAPSTTSEHHPNLLLRTPQHPGARWR